MLPNRKCHAATRSKKGQEEEQDESNTEGEGRKEGRRDRKICKTGMEEAKQ